MQALTLIPTKLSSCHRHRGRRDAGLKKGIREKISHFQTRTRAHTATNASARSSLSPDSAKGKE